MLATIAAAALSLSISTGMTVQVAPSVGSPGTTFRVAFTAPRAAGHIGILERSYSVAASLRARRGCESHIEAPIASARAGERVRVSLHAARGMRWCRGRFRGQIVETEGPYCVRPRPCPAFPTRQRKILSFRFRVR